MKQSDLSPESNSEEKNLLQYKYPHCLQHAIGHFLSYKVLAKFPQQPFYLPHPEMGIISSVSYTHLTLPTIYSV